IVEQLPPERELAESMQVSRAVVNGGIAELARKGFLTVKPRVGVCVADYRRNGTVDTLLSIMNYNRGQLRREEVRSILEIKMVLDRLAVQLAIPKLTGGEQETLRARLESLRQCDNVTLAAAAVFEFYHELALQSGNTLLPLIYYSFRAPVLSLWERYGRKYGLETVYTAAAKLFGAIERRDMDAAVRSVESTVGDAIRGAKEIYEG
ncbi:MAG: FadR family transcriptional regulator, partial [Spirochaetia bacterium]|nr:FadR family transcriptional regulator [Spirochaetia bacterium]